jgi:hypothetical protein
MVHTTARSDAMQTVLKPALRAAPNEATITALIDRCKALANAHTKPLARRLLAVSPSSAAGVPRVVVTEAETAKVARSGASPVVAPIGEASAPWAPPSLAGIGAVEAIVVVFICGYFGFGLLTLLAGS